MVKIFNHPLINDKLTRARSIETNRIEFKNLINEITVLMAYEITSNLNTKIIEIETPIEKTKKEVLDEKIVIAPILRAGLGMVNGMESVLQRSRVAHIGMYRDEETLEIHPYFEKYPPNMEKYTVIILDPMLATGNSAIEAISMIKKQGAHKIKFVGIVGVQEGIDNLKEKHNDVDIYLAAKDDHLNENSYIVPGLGDAGDRIFGTK